MAARFIGGLVNLAKKGIAPSRSLTFQMVLLNNGENNHFFYEL